MIQIALVDSELSIKNDDIIRHIINDDNRASGRFCREINKRNASLLLLDTSKRTRIFFELSIIIDNSSMFFQNSD
jgi:hypothetical protein